MKRRKTKIKNISQNKKECNPIVENKAEESPSEDNSHYNSLSRVHSLELIEERLESLDGFCMYGWVMQAVPGRLSHARTILSLIFQLTDEGTDELMIPTYIFTKYSLCTENTANRNIKWLQNEGFIFIHTEKTNIGNEKYYSMNMDKVQPLVEQYEYSIMNATRIIYHMNKKQLQGFMLMFSDHIPLIETKDFSKELINELNSFDDEEDDIILSLWNIFEKLDINDKGKVLQLIYEVLNIRA